MEIYTKEEAKRIREKAKLDALNKTKSLQRRKAEAEELNFFLKELDGMGVFKERE